MTSEWSGRTEWRGSRQTSARAESLFFAAIPTSDPARNYQWGTMEGGSTGGYFAIRMKSDIIYETEYKGALTQEKYCIRPACTAA